MEKGRKNTTFWRLGDIYFDFIIAFAKGILIVPLYLANIDASLFGAWLATGNILVWLTLFDPGVGDVATQKTSINYASKDIHSLSYQISSSIILSLIVAIVTYGVGILFGNKLLDLVISLNEADTIQLKSAFSIAILNTALTLFYFAFSGTIIGFQRTKITALIRNGIGISSLLLNVVLLLNNYKLLSIAYSGLFSAVAQTVLYMSYLLYILKKEKIGIGFNSKYFFEYSKIFTYTFVAKVFTTVARNIDLIIVSKFIGLEQVTCLEITRRPIRFLETLAKGPSIALLPSMANLYGESMERTKVLMTKLFFLFFLICLFFLSGIILFNKNLITLWVGGNYYLGDMINIILAASFFSTTMSYLVGNFTYSLGKIKENSVIETLKNVIYLILLIVLGNLWGLFGIVLAVFLSSIFTEFWLYPLMLIKTLQIKVIDYREFLMNISLMFPFWLTFLWLIFIFNIGETWSSTILKGIILGSGSIIIYYIFNKVFKNEINFIIFRKRN